MLLTPRAKIKITEWIEEPNPFGLVKIEEIIDPKVKEEELDLEQQVSLRYSKQLVQETTYFLMQRNINLPIVPPNPGHIEQFINMSLVFINFIWSTVLSASVQGREKEMIQDIFAETNLAERLRKLSVSLLDVRRRVTALMNFAVRDEGRGEEGPFGAPEQGERAGGRRQAGPQDERTEDIRRFRKNLENKKVPAAVSKKLEDEINRYLSMEKHHPEASIIRTYLDYLTSMPWGVATTDSLDVEKAKLILDETHYGMDDVKQRILEFLAVGKLQGKVHGKILCFVGPPGVGKTSIGESIARAVSRKFFRISVGGDRDTSTLKGFRRTYVGAIPGKIVQGLRSVQVENPVVLIDEIDKLGGRSVHGDPSSVLLEILDPEQNGTFTDDYLDIPVDLSKVLFLCTANVEYTIPKPLQDRMEMINIAGYTHAEKNHIFSKYLLPQAIERAGLKGREKEFQLSQEATKRMIEDYCREPGVRGLQRAIKRIMEKIAYKVVNGDKNLDVNDKNLEDYIGHPPFYSARIYIQTPPVSFFF